MKGHIRRIGDFELRLARIEEETKKVHPVGHTSINKTSRFMLTLKEQIDFDTPEWQDFHEKLQSSVSPASLVLTAWQIGLWFAKTLVKHHLNQQAQRPDEW